MNKLLKLVLKVVGRVMVWPAIPFRAYARNVVYNYVLQNNVRLKRLEERKPTFVGDGWTLQDVHNLTLFNGQGIRGYIKQRKVNKLQFYLTVLLVWGWLDDDANEDTTDLDYIKTLVDKERYQVGSRLLRPLLKNVPVRERNGGEVVYGNAFDLGDTRDRYAYFHPLATWFWNRRNTAMNWQYLLGDY